MSAPVQTSNQEQKQSKKACEESEPWNGIASWENVGSGDVPDELRCGLAKKPPLQIASFGSCLARIRSNNVNSEQPDSPFQEHVKEKLARAEAR